MIVLYDHPEQQRKQRLKQQPDQKKVEQKKLLTSKAYPQLQPRSALESACHTQGQGSDKPFRDRLKAALVKLQLNANIYRTNRRQRKTDKLALHQLMQLDDALLKDMGLTRTDLSAIQLGALSFDALVNRSIVSSRDSSRSSTVLRK